jgi:CDP-glucose 4,6-dehydratase
MIMRAALRSFAGKRALVTGHTGFKGSWMAYLLKELGADVMGCALPQEPGLSHFGLLNLEASITHVVVDIRDASALSAAMQSFRPECVFHLAAQALVRKSYDDPVATFDSNVMGSVHLLEAVRHCDSVRSLVYITSDKCYENREWVWGYRENDPLGGHDPYSASKAAAEIAFSAYRQSYFSARPLLGAATARAGNVIGGGDWAVDRVVPDCVRAAAKNVRVQLRNPSATRPWQHVLEPLSGYLLLAAHLGEEPARFGGSWNFGPSSSDIRTVEDVAHAISNALGLDRVEAAQSTGCRHEAQLLQLNCDKAHSRLGWEPRWGVDKALDATAEWYKAVAAGCDARAVTRSQIHEYFPELA